MNLLGIDIGYSNLKVAFGEQDRTARIALRPAGAAPADRVGPRIDGSTDEYALLVVVDGNQFVAGTRPDQAEMWARSLHAEYASSLSYRALFRAGLLLAEFDHVDALVTGLPVSQYLDERRRAALAEQLRGTHQLTPKRTVTVSKVKVIPQPIGGFLDYIDQENADLDDALVLVLDPGFFSVDWVIITNRQLHRQSSGTSVNACSVIFERAAKLIAKDYGEEAVPADIEDAVRTGRPQVMVLGKRVEIAPYVEQAARIVAPVVLESVQESLRLEGKTPDLVILVGGGAHIFQEPVKSLFPKLTVAIPRDPVFSNARGFWIMAHTL